MRIAYLYLMRDDRRIIEVAPRHAAYWQGLDLPGYEGGPFVDHSGGLIVFECESLDEARRYVSRDPFVAHDLLHSSWLKQWCVENVSVHNQDRATPAPTGATLLSSGP